MEEKKVGLIKKVNFEISITILFILISMGSILIILFIQIPSFQKELVFISATLGGMATIYSAFIIGQNLKIGITKDAMHRSFELIYTIDNYDFMKNITIIEQELKDKDFSPSVLYSKITENEDLHTAVKSLLTAYQIIALAIIKGYANEEILYIHLRRTAISHYMNYHTYTERRRKELDSPFLYLQFEMLYQSWNSGKYLFSGDVIVNPS